MKTYLVGGAVRDELLGLPVKERDYVVVGSTPDEMLAQGFKSVGKSFPVFLHPTTKEEYALARTERKVAGGYHGFEFNTAKAVTLEEDLQRRDLTINAIAKADDGTLTDPYHGQQDLQAKLLRHVSPAFMEDPVRVLRIARFAARFAHLGFKIAPETLALMQHMVQQGELNYLVSERVWKEMEQALKEQSPWVFVQTLRACGALKIVLPEIDALYDVKQKVLEQAARITDDPQVRFAALVFSNHGEAGIKDLAQRLRIPNDYQQLAMIMTKNHEICHQVECTQDPLAILDLFEKSDAFRKPQRFNQLLMVCEAAFHSRPGYEDKPYELRKQLTGILQACLAIDSKQAMSMFNATTPDEIKEAMKRARLAIIAENLNHH